MKLAIQASVSRISGQNDTLKKIHSKFSFRDKAAANELERLKKNLRWKERSLISSHGDLPEDYLEWKKNKFEELRQAVHVHCCQFIDEETLEVPTGLIPSVIRELSEMGVSYDVEDLRDSERPRRLLTGQKPDQLRRPQAEALDLLLSDRGVAERGIGLIRLATGVGKTALAQELIRKFGHKSIFLVPSLPILKQTVRRFEAAFGAKNVKAYGGGKKTVGYITVATYQSVYKGDPKDFEEIDLVVADEAHHTSADTFYDVLQNKLKNAVHRYGLTAYEERADGSTMLIESAVGPVVYKYDAPEAIRDGYLAKPTFIIYDVFKTQGSWTKYKIKDGKREAVGTQKSIPYNGDDNLQAYRNWVLGNDLLNAHVAGLATALSADNKSVLILVDEKEHGDRLMSLIPGAGYCIGGGKDNERLLKEFNSRKLKVLIGTSTLGEGADTVPVDVLINLQGGASKSQTLQANGRALRNETDENGVARKPTCVIVDFNFPLCDMLSRHAGIREQIHRTMGEVHREKVS